MDWVSNAPPSEASIARARLLEQGFAHVLAVRSSGGAVLGIRALGLDDIEPYLWLTSSFIPQAWVYRGASPLRPARPADQGLPIMGVWGYRVISVIAERAFVNPA
jgi:hypothetical protein